MTHLMPIGQVDADAVERLLDRAFGRDRHGRTAYLLRAGTQAIAALSFAALDGDELLGTIQCWPVWFTGDGDGNSDRNGRARVPLVLVGPVAVAPERQQNGVGRLLMQTALAATDADDALMLIGDPEYYGRFFGFSAERTANWRLPGPVEHRRLLARGHDVPTGAGVIGPRVTADA